MIDKYSRPEMARVWSETTVYDTWLEVEIAVCEAWAAEGEIDAESMRLIRGAGYDIDGINRALAETRHDINSFLHSVADSLGPESRFVHLGLTSSDVKDTALALQMLAAADLLAAGLADLKAVFIERALEHRRTLTMGRTHGVHGEPTSFGLKLLVWVDEMTRHEERLADARRNVAVGKISGAVGSHATVPPSVEEDSCRRLGLEVAKASTQITQRDRHAQFVQTIALIGASLDKFATEVRGLQKTEVREVEEPFGEGQTGSSAMPHKRNPELCERICGLARVLRGNAAAALENVALWHERDISHSSAERVILPRLVPRPRLHARHLHLRDARAPHLPRPDARQPGGQPRAGLLPTRPSRPDRQGDDAPSGLQAGTAQRHGGMGDRRALARLAPA